eukprot:RCo045463
MKISLARLLVIAPRGYGVLRRGYAAGGLGVPGFPLYEKHIFLCTQDKKWDPQNCCAAKGGADLAKKFWAHFDARQKAGEIGRDVKVTQCQCLGRCKEGPAVVVYPKGEWFILKTEDDAKELIDRYVVKHQAVPRLAMPPTSPS